MRFHLKGMLLLALSFVSFSAIADNVTTLELVQNSGETAQFELGKSPVVSTSHDSLVIADATREVRVALSEVKMYHFLTADATSINNVNGKCNYSAPLTRKCQKSALIISKLVLGLFPNSC